MDKGETYVLHTVCLLSGSEPGMAGESDYIYLGAHVKSVEKRSISVENAFFSVNKAFQVTPEIAAPLAETLARIAETAAPRAQWLAPIAEMAPPRAETLAPLAEMAAPTAKTVAPLAETALPVAEIAKPTAETTQPLAEIAFSVAKFLRFTSLKLPHLVSFRGIFN